MSLLYADTSAVVKLYIDEAGSAPMSTLVHDAADVASSVLVWPETLAAFARRHREGLLLRDEHQVLQRRFVEDYQGLAVVSLDGRVLELAQRLLSAHPLRSADAVHLASALFLREQGLVLRFACSDNALLGAALAERLDALDPARLPG